MTPAPGPSRYILHRMPMEAGQSLSFHEILDSLGAGGMGGVHRARHGLREGRDPGAVPVGPATRSGSNPARPTLHAMVQSPGSTMLRFRSELVPGQKAPYDTWTFVVVPDEIYRELGQARPAVRGTVEGVAFRETINRSGGVPRMLVRRDLLDRIGASKGDVVEVRLELDPVPRTVEVPPELEAVLEEDSHLAELYSKLSPSLRRAWATYVDEAKRLETRLRRAEKAREGIREKLYPNE